MILAARDRLLRLPDEVSDRLAVVSDAVTVRELLTLRIEDALTSLTEYGPQPAATR